MIGAFALVLAQVAPSPPAVTVALGAVTPRVVCESDPRFSYALYLPHGYAPGRPWPILYIYDPRGRGAFAAELFAEAAKAHGLVIASSNDTRSDDPAAPNAAAVTAMWRDTHSRIAIDPRRRYATGFSGTARVAARLALTQKGGLAGVIAVGGRLAEEAGKEKWPFALFGAAGEDDFNHPEMWRLAFLLAKNGTPHRMVEFPGGHEWLPAAMALEAFDWFALRAGPADPAVAARYRSAVAARASALETAGRNGEALRVWEGLAEDLPNDPGARAEIQRLGEAARRDLERVRKQADQDRAWIESANARMIALAREDVALPRLVRVFEVDALRKQSSSADPVLAHSAARRLNAVATSAAYYVPEHLKAQGQLGNAARWYQLAAAIDPDSPAPHLGLARLHARAGNRKAALEALRASAARGLRLPRKRLADDPELVALAGDPAFHEILAALPPS